MPLALQVVGIEAQDQTSGRGTGGFIFYIKSKCLYARHVPGIEAFRFYISLLYPCFKTALRYGVVSGCRRQVLLPGSGRNSLQNAALQRQSWLLERPKVRAKSMQKLLGHNAALQGRNAAELDAGSSKFAMVNLGVKLKFYFVRKFFRP